MEHVVFYPAPDGTPAFRRVASLDDAVRLVEHLRNVELIDQVSCHALAEVPLAFRAYYRVEVPGSVSDEVPPVVQLNGAASVPEQPSALPEPAEAMAMAAANGAPSDGAKSLGFFA